MDTPALLSSCARLARCLVLPARPPRRRSRPLDAITVGQYSLPFQAETGNQAHNGIDSAPARAGKDPTRDRRFPPSSSNLRNRTLRDHLTNVQSAQTGVAQGSVLTK